MSLQIVVGTDLVEIKRIASSMKHLRFLTRVFSASERIFFASRNYSPATVAANFAAKEAFSKALGTGIRHFKLSEVSVLRDELGAPFLEFTGQALHMITEKGLTFSVSLSHTKDYAMATVIAYRADASMR